MFRWTLEFDLPNSPTKNGANCSTFLTPSIFIMNTLTSTTSIAMGKNPPVGGFYQEKWGCSMAMLVYLRVFVLLLMSLRVMALVQPSQPGVTPFMPPVVIRGIFAQVGTRWCPRCLAITWMVLKSEITLDLDQFSSLFLRDISPNGVRCLFLMLS